MNRWQAKRSFGIVIGLLSLLGASAGLVWSVLQLLPRLQGSPDQWVINLQTFGLVVGLILSFGLICVLLYRVASALTLHYQVDRNAVTAHWLGNVATIPMHLITGVASETHVKRAAPLWRRLTGFVTGQGKTSDQALRFYSTASLKKSVILQTADAAYVVSPAKRDEFINEVEGRRNLGIVQLQQEGTKISRLVAHDFWLDRGMRWTLSLALLLNLGLWAMVMWKYVSLPPEIALRFDANGTTIGVSPRQEFLLLPLFGFLAWLSNVGLGIAIYRIGRIGSLLLQIGSIVVQLLLIVAALGIIRGL